MKISSGIYNNHGYVQIRIWPWGKAVEVKPYTEAGFGCWCEDHIKAAEKRLRAIRDQVDEGKFTRQGDVKEITIPDACEIYHRVSFRENRARSQNAILKMKYDLQEFARQWPTTKFHLLPAREIREYFNKRLDAGIAAGTVKRSMGILASVYNVIINGVRIKDIEPIVLPDFNPVGTGIVKRPSTVDSKRTRVASWEELQRVKRYCLANDPEFWNLIEFSVTSLYRKQEALKAMETGNTRLVAGKTGKAHHMPVKVAMARITNFSGRWDKIRVACKMTDFHWQDWKHTGATLMQMLGTSIEVLNEMMEHSDLKTTRIYTNAQMARFEPEVNRLKEHLEAL